MSETTPDKKPAPKPAVHEDEAPAEAPDRQVTAQRKGELRPLGNGGYITPRRRTD